MTTPWAALIRGINVGAHAQLPMADLVKMFAAAGARDTRAYLRSGNVAFAASATVARALPKKVTAAIDKQFSLRPLILLRDHDELVAAMRANPFPRAPERELYVAFLAEAPNAAAIARLDPERSPGDSFAVRGRELYAHLPRGASQTKLTGSYVDGKLGTASTWRNWNTFRKLIELTG